MRSVSVWGRLCLTALSSFACTPSTESTAGHGKNPDTGSTSQASPDAQAPLDAARFDGATDPVTSSSDPQQHCRDASSLGIDHDTGLRDSGWKYPEPSDSTVATPEASPLEAGSPATPPTASDATAPPNDATANDAATTPPTDDATANATRDACAYAYVDQCPELGRVRAYDSNGSTNESDWVEIKSSDQPLSAVRNLVIQSDLARVTYEYLNDSMQASHSLYLHTAGAWQRLTGTTYGDYTYWGTSVTEPADSVQIVQLSRNMIAAKFHLVHTIDNAIYQDLPVTIEKTVAIHRCFPGMFVGFHTDPLNIAGERELGFGVANRVAASKRVLALHPEAGAHVNLEIEQTNAPYWAIGLHAENDVLLRYLFVNRPLQIESYQFSPQQWGLVTAHFIDEQSQEPERFQLFIGGMSYPAESLLELDDAADAGEAESDGGPNSAGYARLHSGSAVRREIKVPVAGTYSVWLRHRNSGTALVQLTVGSTVGSFTLPEAAQFSATLLGEPIALGAGSHELEVEVTDGRLDADAIVVVPFGGNALFPEELGAAIKPMLTGE